MIINTSYTDKKITKQINEAVGRPFSLIDRIRLGGIGSRRMAISDISNNYKKYLNADHYISNANIELRPKGILIHFRHKLQAYTWLMPFSRLLIDYNKALKINADGDYIEFSKDLDQRFIEKVIRHQEKFSKA